MIKDMNKRLKLFHYAGGDFFIAKELLSRINGLCPNQCSFVEIFGGSGYISQIIDKTKFSNVIYNDIDSKLTTLYKMVKEKPKILQKILYTIPYSRELNRIIINTLKENKTLSEIELAVFTFYVLNSTFYGKFDNGFAFSIKRNVSKPYFNKIDKITEISKLWRNITIENLNFKDVIKKYDRESTVFYADPPFVNRNDYYSYTFSENDLKELALLLSQIKGKFLLKLDLENYSLVKDILATDKYKIEKLEKTLSFNKVINEKRKKWVLVLITKDF